MFHDITVAGFCIRCLNDDMKVCIWNCEKKQNCEKTGTVFEGSLQEAGQSVFANELVGSFSIEEDMLCINI